ncbi:MAG: transposase [Gammaproteobacteria bacterium]|nr:transposase [Pseudomonadales bacterium]MCP5349012.1 transposase [Pseudomonadales bacterium]
MSEREYSREFQKEAAKQVVRLDHSIKSVSERLGVPESSLAQWVNAYIRDSEEQKIDALEELRFENLRLKKELKLAQEELEILRRSSRFHPRVERNRS